MTLEELKMILDKTGLKVGYRQWPTGEAPDLPYILYYQEDTDNLKADNKTYYKQINVTIELYSNLKNIPAETKLEAILDQHKIEWDAFERFIEDEQMHEILYEIIL
ncbi:hypothetical protein [Enterococcus wangshanyuanii]|uniref:Prophage pi2 protein 38 n=1 Tax=Enterococcus wangshanyuanii TaxID=2005703 RepID=A0ABQ1P712_9ENTE|nr:hypothetical protein [Enterococcus wangshanyuanii]GGC88046.1 hypothetical protein GCM10011573_17060 [Enterococcus wangshanyuanii]